MFVRFQSDQPSARGTYPGVFALANGLARDGLLTADEHAWWRRNNDWFDNAYVDPGRVDSRIFDRDLHSHTACWFKQGAADHLLERLPGYLRLLDKYGVGWVKIVCGDPGRVIYEDDVQVVVWIDTQLRPSSEPLDGVAPNSGVRAAESA